MNNGETKNKSKTAEANENSNTQSKITLEAQSEFKSLTLSDRLLCRAFFGFIPTIEISTNEGGKIKSKSQACQYVLNMLWPSSQEKKKQDRESIPEFLEEKENEEEEKEGINGHGFSLREMLLRNVDIPRIFVSENNDSEGDLEALKQLFLEGRKYSDIQQSAFLRSLSVNENNLTIFHI